jgi:hypothetical protein
MSADATKTCHGQRGAFFARMNICVTACADSLQHT